MTHPGLPRLTPGNHRITSPATPEYNCIAWASGDTANWWETGVFWPTSVPTGDYGIGVLELAFRAQGYEDCAMDDRLEPEYEKVALYGSGLYYTHAAKQLPSGRWTSKLGKWVDIEHDSPQDVAGDAYGEVVQLMKRSIRANETTAPS